MCCHAPLLGGNHPSPGSLHSSWIPTSSLDLTHHKQAKVCCGKPDPKATVQTTVNLLLIYCSQNSQGKAECRYCSSPGITPQGTLLLLVPVLRPTVLGSKNHKQPMSKAFQTVITNRLSSPSGHLFYSASSFYPNYLNGHCLSFSVHKSLTRLFAILGLKSLCIIQFLFQQLLLLVHIWTHNL